MSRVFSFLPISLQVPLVVLLVVLAIIVSDLSPLLAALVVLVFSVTLGGWLFVLLFRRSRALAASIDRFGTGQFATRATTQGRDELGFVARAFNQMAERIDQVYTPLTRREADLQTALDQAQAQQESLQQARQNFLNAISHELRTPLNGILNFTEALHEQVFGPLNDQQIHLLRTIDDSGHALLDKIKTLLDLAAVEAGTVELAVEPVDLLLVCQTALQRILDQATQKHIQVMLSIEPDLPVLQADSRRLMQILSLLLDNAVKFTPESGTVRLQVAFEQDSEMFRFAVADSGIGIAQEDLERLFAPFVQIDAGLDRQYGGLGIGLRLASRLAALQGGSLQASSQIGQGSEFVLHLPVFLP